MQSTKKLSRFALPLCAVTVALGGIIISASSAVAQSVYRPSQNDPFAKRKPVVVMTKRTKNNKIVVVKPAPTPIVAPDVQVRIDRYRAQKMSAMNAQTPAPKPVTAFLLDEMQVTGIFRTPRGYAAMVEATPIKLTYVIYPGEEFYDGQLVAVEENRLVFRRVTNFSDGKRDIKVEMKPLRKAGAVTDAMNARGASPAPVTAPPPPPVSTTANVPSSLPE